MGATYIPAASFALQPRDLRFLRDLFESRVMTLAHAADLHFAGSKEAAKKRLQKLKSAGLIAERIRRVNEPAILFLAKHGLDILQKEGVLAEYPSFDLPVLVKRARVSPLTINHELSVMDVKAAFHAALQASATHSIAEFCTWPRLHEFESDVLVKPDGFIRIHEKETDGSLSEHTFFLEVDRSSETLDILVSRAQAYISFYKSGGFAVKNGAPRSAFRDYPFRLLIVLKSAERRNNVIEALLQGIPPILTQVYLSTIDAVNADPFGAVWVRPIDYRDATRDSEFSTERQRRQWGYQRNTARDVFVQARTPRRPLIDS